MPIKKMNLFLTTLMIIISLLALTGTVYVVKNNYDPIYNYLIGGNQNNVKLGTPLENCKSVAERLKIDVNVRGTDLVMKRLEINNPEMLFSKVSAMTMACTQYRLDAMCVGTECPGASFTAVFKDINGNS